MATDESKERPPMRLPYVRVEGAGGSLVWIIAGGALSVPVFLVARFFPDLKQFSNLLAVAIIIALLVAILDYMMFEERCDIDSITVRYKRKSLFGTTEWAARLNTYRGVALVTTSKKSSKDDQPARAHWSRRKPERLIRLLNRDANRSITLWELDQRDFRDAINHRLHLFSELFKVDVLPSEES